jgi:uracil-DNA glycosylase family 4
MKMDDQLESLKEEILHCKRDGNCFQNYNQLRILLGRRANKDSIEKIKVMFIGEGPKKSFEPTKEELISKYKDENYSNGSYLRNADGGIAKSKGELFGLYSTTGKRLLNRILKKIKYEGQTGEKISYLTNCIKCSQMEEGKLGKTNYCGDFIKEEITIVDPDLIVLLGAKAKNILGEIVRQKSINYEIQEIELGRRRKVISIEHPTAKGQYVLTNEKIEKVVEMINSLLNGTNASLSKRKDVEEE